MLSFNPGKHADTALCQSMRLGFDLVQISQIANSIEHFGKAFKTRLFTLGELAYAERSEAFRADRLAARFAAKEAVIKALGLSEAGISWRDIEVCKQPGGDCEIVLHGRVAELADAAGLSKLLLSLSHDGDYAGAFVTAIFAARH
jgi:holo-[acyl-carrier protein] synthase